MVEKNLDIPEIKVRCEADPTCTFIGDEMLELVEALEGAQEKIAAVRERAKQGRKIMERDMYLFAGDILTILGESQ